MHTLVDLSRVTTNPTMLTSTATDTILAKINMLKGSTWFIFILNITILKLKKILISFKNFLGQMTKFFIENFLYHEIFFSLNLIK